jgi:hypothetical protein
LKCRESIIMAEGLLSGIVAGFGKSVSTFPEELSASAAAKKKAELDARKVEIDQQNVTIKHLRFLEEIRNVKNPKAREGMALEYARGIGADFGSPEFTHIMSIIKDKDAANEVVKFLIARMPGVTPGQVEDFVGAAPGREELSQEDLLTTFKSSLAIAASRGADDIRTAAKGKGRRAEMAADIKARQFEIGRHAQEVGDVPSELRTSLRASQKRLTDFDALQASNLAATTGGPLVTLRNTESGDTREFRRDDPAVDRLIETGKWVRAPISLTGTPDELKLTPQQSGNMYQREIRLAFDVGDISSLVIRGQQLGLAGVTGFRGPLGELLGGTIGQLDSRLGEAITLGISGVSPADLGAWRIRARALVVQQIPLMTGEESGRVTDIELKLTTKYTRITAATASDEQVLGALSAIAALKILDLQQTQLVQGKRPMFSIVNDDPAKTDENFNNVFAILQEMFPAFTPDVIGGMVAELERREKFITLMLTEPN